MITCMSLTAGHWAELTGAQREPGGTVLPHSLIWLSGERLSGPDRDLAHRWLQVEGLPEEVIGRLFDSPRAHLERGDDYIVLVVDSIEYDEPRSDVVTGHVLCVFTRRMIVTVALGASPLFPAVTAAVRKLTRPRGRDAVVFVLATLLTEVLSGAEEVEGRLSESIADIEQDMFTDAERDPVERIYTLKRQVSRAEYTVGALSRPLQRLATDDGLPGHDKEGHARLHRLSEWAHRLEQLLEADDRMLGDMLQVHLTQVSVRQNEDMRKISAWAGLVAVPTLISGVYGMNFRVIPWLDRPWGFPVVMAGMVAVCVILYRVFKRSGWL